MQFHIQHFGPLPNWPNGGWSLYEITGDQIADRIGIVRGKVVRRDPWPGYVGTYESLETVMAEIQLIKESK